tara:strand:+ start:2264 stop:3298 length:1035 start_codon:yes stop_codon:yes gene_type:complete
VVVNKFKKLSKNSFNIEVVSSIDSNAWDNIIKQFLWCNLYQSYNWGEIKKEYGWLPQRTIAKNNLGKVIAAVQILTKKKYGCIVGWAPGGPLCNDKSDSRVEIAQLLNKFFNERAILKYLRIYPMIPSSEEDEKWLSCEGWRHSKAPFHKSLTIMVNIEGETDSIRESLKGKWRYYLKRSETFEHKFKILIDNKDISLFIDAHKEMTTKKGFNDSFDLKELNILKNKLKDNLLIFGVFDGEIFMSGWIMARFINTAYVLRAVTTKKGRESLASYFCLWEAMKHLKMSGCKRIEMGGIDLKDNKGVTHFKRGVGGEEIQWLGEWEKANSGLTKLLMNSFICLSGK